VPRPTRSDSRAGRGLARMAPCPGPARCVARPDREGPALAEAGGRPAPGSAPVIVSMSSPLRRSSPHARRICRREARSLSAKGVTRKESEQESAQRAPIRSLLTSCSRQEDTRGHRTTPDDTGRHVEPGSVRSASNLRIRWPRGRGSSSLPSRTKILASFRHGDRPSTKMIWWIGSETLPPSSTS
jgi:hypothetical protein